MTARFTGLVAKVSEEAIVLMPEDFSPDDDPGSLIAISLQFAVSFAFADPREGGSGREILKEEMEFGISIFFLSGERCILYELAHSD